MNANVEKYLALLGELELLRTLAGGDLGQELEFGFAIKLDPLWDAMDETERAQAEEELVRPSPTT